MNNYRLNQLMAMYFNALYVLFEMLHKYGTALHLMVPGIPEQLSIENGVELAPNGIPIYYAVVKRFGNPFRSPMAFGQAVQAALDATCYQNCLPRLVLHRVNQLPQGYIGLTLSVEG